VKLEGTPVKADFFKPREWVERSEIVAGSAHCYFGTRMCNATAVLR
jgi:hypothetical protein